MSNQNKLETALDKTPKRQRCSIWTRVMGYHRPVSYFNIGKKAEHYSRQHFNYEKSNKSLPNVTT